MNTWTFYIVSCSAEVHYTEIVKGWELDRNIFASCMVHCGHADALVTGVRAFQTNFEHIRRVIDVEPESKFMTMSRLSRDDIRFFSGT